MAAPPASSMKVLFELVPNRADAHDGIANLECGDQTGVPEGNDQLTLPVVSSAGGFAA